MQSWKRVGIVLCVSAVLVVAAIVPDNFAIGAEVGRPALLQGTLRQRG